METNKVTEWVKRVIASVNAKPGAPAPPYSGAVIYGNLVYISGIGAHIEGDIKVQTKRVLDDVQRQLEAAGSSMEKCLKCSVFLLDIKDFDAMNEVYRGRFGSQPPARTTVAVAGIPGNALVEMDVVAFI
jgi:reactive intermediate/imine deaminase